MHILYVAGFFDGEGSLSRYIRKAGCTPRFKIEIVNTYRLVLVAIQEFLGCGVVRRRPRQRWGKKQQWRLNISSKSEVLRTLKLLEPHLIEKRAKVRSMIRELEIIERATGLARIRAEKIRREYDKGSTTTYALAAKYGVNQSTVWRTITRKVRK